MLKKETEEVAIEQKYVPANNKVLYQITKKDSVHS